MHKTDRGEYDTERLIEALKEHFVPSMLLLK